KKILKFLGTDLTKVDIKIANLSYLKSKGMNISQYHASTRYGLGFNQDLFEIGYYDKFFASNITDGITDGINKDFMMTYDHLNLKYGDDSIDLNDVLRIDLSDYMVGDILVKVDRATMANSLEARAPFLDVDFATFCLSLPYTLKINDEKDKLIMRMVMEEKWPESIRNRPKHGFGSPIRKILEQQSFKKITKDYFSDISNPIFDIISFDKTNNYLNKNYDKITEKKPQFLWNLITLAAFAKTKKFSI
ncbi:MAG: asparagine synthase-related protein, partial [Alphaproteobacteria bacterium]